MLRWAGNDAIVLLVMNVVDGVANKSKLVGTTEQSLGIDAGCCMDSALIEYDDISKFQLWCIVIGLVQ